MCVCVYIPCGFELCGQNAPIRAQDHQVPPLLLSSNPPQCSVADSVEDCECRFLSFSVHHAIVPTKLIIKFNNHF